MYKKSPYEGQKSVAESPEEKDTQHHSLLQDFRHFEKKTTISETCILKYFLQVLYFAIYIEIVNKSLFFLQEI
ncbi:hypothetical protein GDO86_019091 [Hymenochirus boettgeri]|uniref:Uncharacterized protein n=1 Tax=Hymenochirus boettgeri TaxID=247094 RepID=A0A8T2ID95_9PIPI|nr:hypothetical protein GDO86_019091 [Hymenochirus boettgeri]